MKRLVLRVGLGVALGLFLPVLPCGASLTINYDGSVTPNSPPYDFSTYVSGPGAHWSSDGGILHMITTLGNNCIWFGNDRVFDPPAWLLPDNNTGTYVSYRMRVAPGSTTLYTYLRDGVRSAAVSFVTDHVALISHPGTPDTLHIDPTLWHDYSFFLRQQRVTYWVDGQEMYSGTATPNSSSPCLLVGDGNCTTVLGTGELDIDFVQILSGDLLMGSCCIETGTCSVTNEQSCTGQWTAFMSCDPNPCPAPDGACCGLDGSCTVMNEAQCSSVGTWLGAGTTCTPSICPPPTGACCAPDGSCAMTTEDLCSGLNTWQGVLTNCTSNPCPPPFGACCSPDGSCVVTTQMECPEPTYWQGPEIPCSPDPCSWVGIADNVPLAASLSIRVAPNPFAGPTDLAFAGPGGTEAALLIVDASGRRVRTAWLGVLDGRTNTVHWDGRDDSAREVPAGVYLARLRSGARSVAVRLVKAR